ncbi:MAG: hypothetical protein LUD50_01980 [Clostridia bacterium]|nr:hypothetical protein [Clostridia bacterium]
MTKKSKAASILAAVLMTAAIAATAVSFAGCTTGTSDKADKKDDNVLFSTSFTMGVMGDASFTFKTDGTAKVSCEQKPSLDATIPWTYKDTDTKTQIGFEWGEGGTQWTARLVMIDDSIVSTQFSSDSAITAIKGPFIAYPDGVAAALTSTTDISFNPQLNGAPVSLVLFDKEISHTEKDDSVTKTNLILTYGDSVFYNVSWSLNTDKTYTFSVGPFGEALVPTKTTESKYQSGKIGGMTFDTFGASTSVEFIQLQP